MIVITGALGFIGSVVAKDMMAEYPKEKFLFSDLLPLQARPRLAESLLSGSPNFDYCLSENLFDRLNSETEPVRWIIHMGACSSTTEMNREYLYQINTLYSVRLCQWARDHNAGFIYASSGATYGGGELGFGDWVDSEQLNPLNPYGESKVLFDRWILKQPRTPENWYGLKFFNVYGPNENHKGDMASVVFKAFQQIQETGKLQLFRSHRSEWQDGKQRRDFVYVKDISRWMSELMRKKPQSGLYNMGYGQSRTWLDLAHAVFFHMQRPVEIDWIDVPERIRDRYQYLTEARMDRLLSVGLSAPQWSLEEGIADYLERYLKPGLLH